MKKFSLICFIFVTIVASSFAGAEKFFSNRFLELKVDIPVNLSNNVLSVSDILKKDLVIDLESICNNLPKKGFDLSVNTIPSAYFTINLPKSLVFGLQAGADIYSNVGLSKDLFEYIAYGNDLNETVKVDFNGYVDVFAYAQANIGWHGKKLTIIAQPALFTTIAHATSDNTYISVTNTDEGSFIIDLNQNFSIYSPLIFTDDLFSDTNTLVNSLLNSPAFGFDFACKTEYKLMDYLNLTSYIRIPIVPSKLTQKTLWATSYKYEFNIMKLAEGEDIPSFDFSFGDPSGTDTIYSIHRPMKITLGADFHPFSWIMYYYGSLGIGIKHPFAKNKTETGMYIDYLLGTRISLINMINLYISTERTDEVFIHKAVLGLNLRIVEIDAGVAFESASFASAFKGTGIGAFVTACVGF